jgi:hypothetical protein
VDVQVAGDVGEQRDVVALQHPAGELHAKTRKPTSPPPMRPIRPVSSGCPVPVRATDEPPRSVPGPKPHGVGPGGE